MARPSTQQQRRRDLIEATIAAGAKRGLRELSMTDIAKQAGLTRGALLYYYEDLDALLVETHRAGNERIIEERERLIEAATDPHRRLRSAIDAGLPTGPDDPLMRLLYEFDVLAGNSPLHDELVQTMYVRQRDTYLRILVAGQDANAFAPTAPVEDIAMNFVALEDAYGLHIVAGNRHITVDDARRAIYAFAAQSGCPVDEASDGAAAGTTSSAE